MYVGVSHFGVNILYSNVNTKQDFWVVIDLNVFAKQKNEFFTCNYGEY